MEKLNGEKLPECVKFLLTKSAYNTIATLREINEDKLLNIETFLDGRKDYIAALNCCYHDHYQSLEVFEFLPGHKDLILNMPSQIQQLNGSKKACCKTKDVPDDELQIGLSTNILNYAEKIGLDVGEDVISTINIHNFRRGSDKDNFLCKCKFICPFCAKSFTVTYKKYWGTSNITKHLKEQHLQAEQ